MDEDKLKKLLGDAEKTEEQDDDPAAVTEHPLVKMAKDTVRENEKVVDTHPMRDEWRPLLKELRDLQKAHDDAHKKMENAHKLFWATVEKDLNDYRSMVINEKKDIIEVVER